MTEILRHRTAIGRGGELSLPVRAAVEAGLLTDANTFFDYGMWPRRGSQAPRAARRERSGLGSEFPAR